MALSYWTFPPPASPSFFDNGFLETNLVTYLNTSASAWPAVGFGKSTVYSNDEILAGFNSTPRSSGHRGYDIRCMPCHQTLHSADEALNWDACRYGIDESLPKLIIVSTTYDFPTWPYRMVQNINQLSSLPKNTTNTSLICLFGISGSTPYDMTRPFRFMNAVRNGTDDSDVYIFDSTQQEGAPAIVPPPHQPPPLKNDPITGKAHRLSPGAIGGIVAGSILGLVVVLLGLCCCLSRRKLARQTAAEDKEKSMAKQEEADGDALPGYERPPEYSEAVHASSK